MHASVDEYLHDRIADQLPAHLWWLLECCDPARLRHRYENGAVALWTIDLPDGQVLLFETPRPRR